MPTEQQQIDSIMRELDGVVESAVTEITLEVTDELTRETPVDTGHAKSNWIPSVGSFSGLPVGSQDSVSRSEQSAGESRVHSYRLEQGKAFIVNNVGYISQIINSRQVEVAIDRALRLLDLGGLRRR